ncbi:hypothetical protein QYE76_013916 [Lolium multiflorum]|uniref:Integrase catalytic domain-containing protein n=1 Tax=Lolium multiflorum TaxID=4521 RepID=A0AAD8X846_LOLMU|nr:hypothetical protein QYE76_013916 [Lolium multiflorum]
MKTDVKMAVKLDMEDMKISHGREGERRHAREEKKKSRPSNRDNKIVNQENKNSADIITWREYEALRNEMRREFRTKDDELKGTLKIKQTLDATNVTVTGLSDQMTDIQRNIADMRLAIENLTVLLQQQQEDDEDPELEDDAHNARGAPRGHRPRGWVPLGRNGRGQDEEDGLGKPKFSIPKFEGGADVEEYLTWELKIEKLWSLHPHYSEDRKIKLASSEFDGYALRWWDSLVRNLDEDGAQPIRTWRAMKEAMTSHFVPTNYMRNIFDKLTLLRQGVKTVDEYYMEMEMLMQRGRVRESLEMTMQRFLNGLKNLATCFRRRYPQDYHHCEESHAGGLMGHFGREKTLLMLADHFYWPKMRRDVDIYVRRCITCNKSKSKLKPHVYELLLETLWRKLGTKLLFSTTCHPQTDGQTEVVNRTLSQLLRSMIKKNLKEWEECLPHVEFAYNRAVHSTTELCPFEVVYGFKPITPLDLLPLPIHERVNMEASKRADYVKKIHEKTKELIEKKGKSNAARMNKKRKEMLFKPVIWYQEETSIARGEEQLDMKTDVKMAVKWTWSWT